MKDKKIIANWKGITEVWNLSEYFLYLYAQNPEQNIRIGKYVTALYLN